MTKNAIKNIWNANAEFWDKRMGEGNEFHKMLVEPIQLKLLDVKKDSKILDIACGNGQFARKLAELGAHVAAIDFAEKFIALAKSKNSNGIDYRVADVTNVTDLNALSDVIYDSIVCTMALMDMENIEILIDHLPNMLKKDGVFVFSILHPCFNSGENTLTHEQCDLSGKIKSNYSIKISNYLTEKSYLGVGMKEQPESQYYFHRSTSTILSYLFKRGFVLDAFEEPSFKTIENSENIFQNVYKNIPPVLICRLRMIP
jgi:2-polyprenyl-3-methyl-5-hydroxy-6-metoxy-1,4-benzoquinol methylase